MGFSVEPAAEGQRRLYLRRFSDFYLLSLGRSEKQPLGNMKNPIEEPESEDPGPETIFGSPTFEIEPDPLSLENIEHLLDKFARVAAGCVANPPSESSGEDFLTYADVAERLKCSLRHVKNLRASGKLVPAPNLGRMIRFEEKELRRHLESSAKARRCPK